jgi:hypothetical protein
MSEWTIVGGGPSIQDLDLERHRVGTVIGVNRAFYKFPGEIDIWSSMERHSFTEMTQSMPHPSSQREKNIVATVEMLIEHKPMIWIARHAQGTLRNLFREYLLLKMGKRAARTEPSPAKGIKVDTFAHRRLPGQPKARWPWKTEANWGMGSVLVTMAKLVLDHEPTRIRLLGVDMDGVGGWGFAAREGEKGTYPNVKGRLYPRGWWAARWARERENVNVALRELAEQGVVIERGPQEVKQFPVQVEGVPVP